MPELGHTYCVKCRTRTGNEGIQPFTAKTGRGMIKSKCTTCGTGKCLIPPKHLGAGFRDLVSRPPPRYPVKQRAKRHRGHGIKRTGEGLSRTGGKLSPLPEVSEVKPWASVGPVPKAVGRGLLDDEISTNLHLKKR